MVDDPGKDWIPRPDPTRLTTEQLYREIASLKEVIFTRLDGTDVALQLAAKVADSLPGLIERDIHHLEDKLGARMNGMDAIRNEKFDGIQKQFQAARDSAEQHNRAAAEAISKSENNTTKQIDALGTLFSNKSAATDDRITALTDRFNKGEGKGLGRDDTEKIHRDNTGLWIALASSIIAFMALAIGGIGLFIATYHKA